MTIKDYGHSVIYNPRFTGLKGWESSNVVLDEAGVIIKKDGYLSQFVKEPRFWQLETKEPTIIVNLTSGRVKVEVGAEFSKEFKDFGRHEIKYQMQKADNKGFDIRITNQSDSNVHINSINIIGHKQEGKIFDMSGMPNRFQNLISTFNHSAAKSSLDTCKEFTKSFSEKNIYKTKGVLNDGWTTKEFGICKNQINSDNLGFSLEFLIHL